ncbi:MAG: FAD-dependent oxidoreductase [Gammaproteobacteria bacterium]|nr:MAG: FAD-dependent oxidoreductase [Gammaproteobacteria bacterium]
MKVGIVGAGIMGRLLAFTLVNAGHEAALFDTGKLNSSRVAAGLLSPIAELETADELIYHLGQDALKQHWPAIINKLEDKIYFQTSGSLVLSHPKDKADLTRLLDVIDTKIKNQSCYKKLTHDEVITLEPTLAKFNDVYHFQNEAHVDNQALLDALMIKEIEWHKNTYIDAVLPGKVQDRKFDLVFDCRGLGAKSIFSDLHGIRGELIWLHAPDVSIKHPIRLIHPRYPLYIVPRPNHVYLVGASEIHSESDHPISVRSTLELLTAAYYVHPGFAEAHIIKTVTQCRPTLASYLPKIKYTDGLIAINGLYRHGFLISPSIAADIMQWLQQGTLCYPQLWENLYDKQTVQVGKNMFTSRTINCTNL